MKPKGCSMIIVDINHEQKNTINISSHTNPNQVQLR